MDELKQKNQKLVECENECKLLENEIQSKKSELFQKRKQMAKLQLEISNMIKADLLPAEEDEEDDEDDEFAFN